MSAFITLRHSFVGPTVMHMTYSSNPLLGYHQQYFLKNDIKLSANTYSSTSSESVNKYMYYKAKTNSPSLLIKVLLL